MRRSIPPFAAGLIAAGLFLAASPPALAYGHQEPHPDPLQQLQQLTAAQQSALSSGDPSQIVSASRQLASLALRLLGNLYAGEGKPGPSAEALTRSWELAADSAPDPATEIDTGLLLVTSNLTLGRPVVAARIEQRLLRDAGDSSRLHLMIAGAHHAADDLAGTIAELTRAIALDPQGASAHLALGNAFWELNEYGPNSDSLREFTEAQQGDPAGYLSNFNLGSVLSQLGHYPEAAPFLAKAAAADPASPDPWLQLGMNAYVGNHPAEALSALEKCVALTGADQARNSYQIRRVYAVLSRLYAEAGSDVEARRLSIRAEEVHAQMLRSDVSSTLSENTSSVTNNSPPRPKPPSALPGLATAPAPPTPPAQPENLQLEQQLQALVANSLNDAGTALARNHDYAAALPLFREASVADPTLSAATRNLGLAAFHTGSYDEAITALTRALEQNPTDTLARTDLDQSLAALRNTHPPPSASPQKP